MKKTILLLTLSVMIHLFYNQAAAQSEKRYTIEMSFTYKGKTVKTALSSANYSISRDMYDADSLYPQKRYIYYAVTPLKMEKDLLLAIKDKKAKLDILITNTDNFGKEAKKEALLKNAVIANISESYSSYSYDNGSSISLGINAGSIVIDGIEIEP